jgi:flavin-dependent dehydrogenase
MVFDARLLDGVRALGAHFTQRTVRRLDVRADRVVVDGEVQARVVIGADGAESVVRRVLGVPANPPRSMAVAIRGYGPELPGQDGAQLITMTAQHWPAYAWSFPIGAGQANLGYGQVLQEGAINRAALLSGLQTLLPGASPHAATLRAHRLPMSTWRPGVAAGRVLLAGDAQSLINPLTGEGIYYAVLSGALAGAAALSGARAGSVYRHGLRRRLGRYLRHATVLAQVSRWPNLMDAVLRGAATDQSTFDQLVDIGLQDGRITGRLLLATLRPRNWRVAANMP